MPKNMRKSTGSAVSGIAQFHVDAYLTNYSEAFMQEATSFVAGRASTLITVEKESGKYAKYPPGFFWRDEAQVRPLGGRPVQVGYEIRHGTYLAEEWALEHPIDDRQRANARNQVDLDRNAVRLLDQKQMIRADRMWAEAFFQAGVWTNEVTGGTDFTSFNDASSDPVDTIDEHKEVILQATGMEPNTIIMGHAVKRALRSNPAILDRIKYTERANAGADVLASLFEVENVMTCRAIYNAADETVDEAVEDDFQFICDPNAMLLAYIAPVGTTETPTAIGRFSWTGLIPGQGNDFGGVIERGRDDRAHSDWFQSRQAFDLRQISPDLAVFYSMATTPVSN